MAPDLSEFLTPIKIEGADAAGFLHGQFTTDVTGLASGRAGLSAWCDPKGRVIATFILARLNGTFWLLLPGALKDTFIRRLNMYVLRADVNIIDVNVASVYTSDFGFLTKDSKAIFFGVQVTQNAIIPHDEYIVISYPAGDIIALIEAEKTSELPASLSGFDSDAPETAFIRKGIPWISLETSGRLLPQELNLDCLDALSYTKGCYPGQEIVARLRYRGVVKRRLCHAITDNPARLQPGTALVPEGEERNIGTVINSAITGKGQELLIVLERPFIETGHVVAEDFPASPVKSIKETTGSG